MSFAVCVSKTAFRRREAREGYTENHDTSIEESSVNLLAKLSSREYDPQHECPWVELPYLHAREHSQGCDSAPRRTPKRKRFWPCPRLNVGSLEAVPLSFEMRGAFVSDRRSRMARCELDDPPICTTSCDIPISMIAFGAVPAQPVLQDNACRESRSSSEVGPRLLRKSAE